jgi:hypothetical protein
MRALAPLVFAIATAACELQEVVLTEVDDVVVAEVVVQVRDNLALGGDLVAYALLHRTSGSAAGVPGARVVIHTPSGPVELLESPESHCLWVGPPEYGRTCYRAPNEFRDRFRPGEALTLEIALAGGGRLQAAVRVPGDFQLIGRFGSGSARPCRLAPGTNFDLEWSRSDGAWAYVAETGLEDLQRGFAAEGIEVPGDYLYLLGLAISGADTTIAFPREFGLVERFSVGRDLALALQRGLPVGAFGRVSVAAVERNYTNWARGGTFNPSGQVRIPSIRGDGTGFFGATVVRTMTVVVPPAVGWGDGETLPPCG